jgi:hypothetical protein
VQDGEVGVASGGRDEALEQRDRLLSNLELVERRAGQDDALEAQCVLLGPGILGDDPSATRVERMR